ncbi:YLP motif-containing protein 1 isoform X2 [Vigna unguiculata]|uniref:YLP motif-containing protein 1 isoform X2 n=1 Tax=Vigna unguiculata TaxID=3917 RepID=UPI0010168808|nr:YLP motif-containing protein 1 isoform X2 [Vigna unguiculata]
MDHRQWRPTPPPNLCPTCSLSHFPFCPAPPPPPYHHPHQPPLPYASANPNFQNFKRPRIHDNNTHPLNFSDDQRRLQLIRDHGTNPSLPHTQNAFHPHDAVPPHHRHNAQFRSSPHPFHPYPDPSQCFPDVSPAPYHHSHAPHVGMQPPPPPHVNFPSHEGNHHNQHKLNGRVGHYPYPYPAGNNSNGSSDNNMEASRFLRGHPQPPLPSSPPPPLPMEPSMNQYKTYFSPPKKPASLFPVQLSSSPSSFSQVPEPHSLPQPYHPTGFPSEEPSKHYLGDSQPFSLNQFSADRPKFIDAANLFRHPHRASRPDHFVIIFRGLPGSGKSYLAKMLRDLEVENGGDAPRIHSMDDYFMTEVEDSEASKSSSSGRNKKPVTKKVMEYCYEPEMEEAYRSSMLKAFKKTVEEGVFTFIIVDDRNLRVADFAQFWATAKRSGYEVYILEATYKDPVGCAARNVHGFTQEDIEKMSKQWEEAPSLYLQLDVKSLFHGDDLKESRIQEVDMDMEDDMGDVLPPVQGREAEKVVDPTVEEDASFLEKTGKKWDAEGEHPTEVRELGKSKWSEDFSEDDIGQTEGMKGNINALSGLIHQYGKERKSVHWGDQGGKTGFSIGAARKVNALSIVIGPGAGYNLKSNPLPEEDSPSRNSVESKKHSIFQERIRAERESFKAVFDRRRHRIGGLDVEED